MSETKDIIKKHIRRVQDYLAVFQRLLFVRGMEHDQSKLDPATELSYFEEYAPKLKECVYGDDEYKMNLEKMKPALEHHYANNRHHPEHYSIYECAGCFKRVHLSEAPDVCCECGYTLFERLPGDLSQMNLVDLIEMLCDWKAAGEQHKDGGDIFRSIEINQERFGYSDEVKSILLNTAKIL
jgi:hypothetical protein